MSSIMRSACKSLLLIVSSPSLWMMTHPHPDTSVRVQTDLMSLTQQLQHQLQAFPHQEVRPWFSSLFFLSLFSPTLSGDRRCGRGQAEARQKGKEAKEARKEAARARRKWRNQRRCRGKTARSLLASLHVSIWGRTCNTWSRLSVRHARAAWLRTIGRS